ncbi:MAG: VanZ family protein, partial [bacterium]
LSWFYVASCSLFIFATIPFARTLQQIVQDNWGRTTFSYVVITMVVSAAVTAVVYLVRQPHTTRRSYVWLAVVSLIFIGYTIKLSAIPEEALHFVEYAFLSVLIYRALIHQIRDVSIYFTASVIGAIVGMLDEAIQWATPRRVWGLDDIWLDFFAVALTQLAIARGLRPSTITGKPGSQNIKRFCVITALAAILLAASLLNTPARIAWYAERLPLLRFLVDNESVMFEYGHYYEDPEIGHFRSRFSPEELRRTDETRASEAAAILNRYRSDSTYSQFLKTYTPATDPFLHEARVHLFRRDRYFQQAKKESEASDAFQNDIVVAHRENLIMEKYFPNTLKRSNFALSAEDLTYLEKNNDATIDYGSGVSWDLVTSTNEGDIKLGLVAALLALGFTYTYFSKKIDTGSR